ncbi:MAG: YihY/virulence factor BrkB family protein [Acidimicrobiaceae bacterium]|nr:YihY/virulence factor BrkB family protein [Acidimicrobiaceae bacterium]
MKYSAVQDTIKGISRRVNPLAERYRSDSVGLWSTKVAYLSFFSLFPLLLLFSSVLNIAFSGHQAYKESVASAVDSNFPFLAGYLPSGKLRSTYFAGSAGLIGSLWSGSRLTLALESGLGRIWHLDDPEARTFLAKLLRGAFLFILFGVIFIASNIPVALVSGTTSRGNLIVQVVGLIFGYILDLVLFVLIQFILGPPGLTYKDHLAGSVLAAGIWLVMVRFGDSLLSKYVSHASQTYGTLGTIIGLLTWLTVGSLLVFGAAIINTLEYEKRHARK